MTSNKTDLDLGKMGKNGLQIIFLKKIRKVNVEFRINKMSYRYVIFTKVIKTLNCSRT